MNFLHIHRYQHLQLFAQFSNLILSCLAALLERIGNILSRTWPHSENTATWIFPLPCGARDTASAIHGEFKSLSGSMVMDSFSV
jgi:hypothetical protein